ncbi:hypothetical protein A2U01_0066140, partial [Trifolium medium]|nr:hypothetical protein [Trifolium medium]
YVLDPGVSIRPRSCCWSFDGLGFASTTTASLAVVAAVSPIVPFPYVPENRGLFVGVQTFCRLFVY